MLRIARKSTRDILITGGAGLIGAHLAAYLLANTDAHITLLDSLANQGAAQNLDWLAGQAGPGRLMVVRGDVRQASRVMEAASKASEIFHLEQLGSSGRDDFNIEGAANVFDAALGSGNNPVVICTSAGSGICSSYLGTALRDATLPAPLSSIPAVAATDVCGSDDLALDYAKHHNLAAVVLRIDTVTGPRQFGDGQDWVARAEYSILSGRPCRMSGNPAQLRDVVHVSDAVQAILAARAYIGKTAGKAYRVSGGRGRWVSVEQMIQLIESVCHRSARIERARAENRDLPQISEDTSFVIDTCWRARRSLEETVRDIAAFWYANQEILGSCTPVRKVPAQMARVQAA